MKKFMAVVLVFVMAFAALPVFAQISAAEDVLLKVKEKIDVPEELTEFNYSENKYDDVIRYDFTWHTEDYSKELYVSSDTLGRIVSYNYYEQADYSSDRTLIDYTIDDARPMAKETVKKMFPEYFAEGADKLVLNEDRTTSSYSGRYKSFAFTFDRVYGDLPVESNRVVVRVRATKEKMYVQSVSASLDEDAEFLDLSAAFDTAKRQEKYEENFPITLYYATDYSGEEREVKLFYSMDKGFVAYNTGKIVTEEHFDRYAGMTEDSMTSMESAGGTLTKNEAMLSPKEQSEIEKMASLIKPEEIDKKLRGLALLKITDDMVFDQSYTYKSEDKYFVSFTLQGEKRYINTTYNGETGEVTSIYSYFTKYDEPEKKTSDSGSIAPQEDIKAFAASLAGNKFEETETEFNTQNERSTLSATRVVNGIPFPENSINVTYDMVNNMVTRYSIYWDDDVSNFPEIDEAITLDEARKTIFDLAGLKDVNVKQEEGYINAVTVNKGVTINAITGEEMYAAVEAKQAYTDIDSHWAEDIINILWEHDIYLAGGKFNPDEAITQADMITLFSACRDSGIVPIGWTKERIAEYGVTSGYVKVAEPDKLMTRREAFEVLINILGYGEIAGFDIYKSSYADLEANGSAEILKAMGVLIGDMARGDDYLTHAEAAVMIYRYLSK